MSLLFLFSGIGKCASPIQRFLSAVASAADFGRRLADVPPSCQNGAQLIDVSELFLCSAVFLVDGLSLERSTYGKVRCNTCEREPKMWWCLDGCLSDIPHAK